MGAKQKRQGDLLFEKVDKIPAEAKRRKSDIILVGEATGHAHRIINGAVFEVERRFGEMSMEMWVEAGRNATVVHEEHNPIALDAGIYAVTRQREYDEAQERLIRD